MHTLLTLFLLFTTTSTAPSSLPSPDHFLKPSLYSSSSNSRPQEYFEITHPLTSDYMPPSCTHTILHHSFANTINSPPFTTPYFPPSDCPYPWSHVALDFRATCKGEQYDRISALWLGGSELLRTSTAEPTQCGIFWTLRKDITRYSSLLLKRNLNLTMMLENVVNSVYTGIYHVEIKLLFYNDHPFKFPLTKPNQKISQQPNLETAVNTMGLYEPPADLIIPISDNGDDGKGFWFRIESESDFKMKKIRIPQNTRKMVMEVYVSFHGNDEFWYSNPPNSYIRMNNLTTNRGNGAYREIFVTIDGEFVGSEVPFPVVFTGGINPLFWEPVVAIGAFHIPSYDFDLSPFLGLVVDGKVHEFGIGVNGGISYWLVDANLHLWLDHGSSRVEAKSLLSPEVPSLSVKRGERFRLLDGTFNIKAKRTSGFVGWVKSSAGNFTTIVSQEFKFVNSIMFQKDGSHKLVKQKITAKKQVKVKADADRVITRIFVRRRLPLNVMTSTLTGKHRDTYVLLTNVSHGLNERYTDGGSTRVLSNTQDSRGWMEVRDHDVINGEATTKQSFVFRDGGYRCYLRYITATGGKLVSDNSSYACPTVM